MWFTVISTALAVVGIWPTFELIRDRVRGRRPLRRMLCLGRTQELEIVVTTSSTGISTVGPKDRSRRASRSLIPSGDLAGVAELSVLLARAYPTRTYRVVPSTQLKLRPGIDQFIVGGPVHNSYAAQFFPSSAAEPGASQFDFDAMNREIVFGDLHLGPNIDLAFERNLPGIDYGYVILTTVQRRGASSRVLLVGGLTTYGTHAAATFAAHDLHELIRREGLGKAPNLQVLVKATIMNEQPCNVEAIKWRVGRPLHQPS